MSQKEGMLTEEDRSVTRSGFMFALATVDDWVGIPFGLVALVELVRSGPSRLKEYIEDKGVFGAVVAIAVAVGLWFLFAPLREIFWQLELMFAWLYVSLWLLFLPITLFLLGLSLASAVVELVQKPSKKRLKRFSRGTFRFMFLSLVYYVSVQFEEPIRIFMEQQMQ